MTGGERGKERFFSEEGLREGRIGNSRAAKPDINSALVERSGLLNRCHLKQLDPQVWISFSKRSQQRGKPTIKDRRLQADSERFLSLLFEELSVVRQAVDPGEDLAGLLTDQFPSWGQCQLARSAIDQRRSKLFLQLPDLSAERRLRNVRFRSRAGKIQGAGQGEEISKLPKFHRTSPVDRKRPPGAAEVAANKPPASRS